MRHASSRTSKDIRLKPVRRAHAVKAAALFIAAFLFYLVLLGCTPHKYAGSVTGITTSNSSAKLAERVVLTVTGTGDCSLRIDYGDGTAFDSAGGSYNFAQYPDGIPFEHYFSGWPGTRTVTVQGVGDGAGDCSGQAQTSVVVGPIPAGSFIPESTRACTPFVNQPMLSPGWHVHITSNPASKIDFGCILSGCVYNVDGEPNSVAPSDYPFPGLRKYSLVARVGGTQVVQGGTDVTFTVDQGGILELCANDNVLGGTSLAWQVSISVDN